MEGNLLICLMAAAAAFACLFSAVYLAAASLTRRFAALAAQGETVGLSSLLKWRLRNGFPLLMPLVRRLLKIKLVAAIAEEAVIACGARGVQTTPGPVFSVVVALLVLSGLFVALVTKSAVGAIAVCASLVAVAHVLAGTARDKRREAVREAVPGALESMSACFGSGFTLLQTFNQVAEDTPGYLGETFERGAHVLETGGTARRALEELRNGSCAADLAFISIALDVQHESGGSMRQVLESASDSVKGELALRRSLRVQTAQAKLSARIVVVMPFILVALFSLASPDFLAPFFSSAIGYALLGLAILMQVAGIFLVNRALAVDGVS